MGAMTSVPASFICALPALAVLATCPAPAAARPSVRLVPASPVGVKLKPVPTDVGGRALNVGERGHELLVRQWPGTYFRTAFRGTGIYFRVGRGDVSLRVSADGTHLATLMKPDAGLYRVEGLANGTHSVRVDILNESQNGPTSWGGFYASRGTAQHPSVGRTARQIEFIGDSHTVGYGNASAKRDCTANEVWASTDTSRSPGPTLARRMGAEYQVNAISGRGVVRNYNGSQAPTLPEAYPFVLFDRKQRYSDFRWRPDLIVISLGTNDFSTALNPGEPWKSRAALQADFRARYADFVQSLSSSQPQARFVLWSTNLAGGEITDQVKMVVQTLRAQGNTRVVFTEVTGLAMSGCDYHPSAGDAVKIADSISRAADGK